MKMNYFVLLVVLVFTVNMVNAVHSGAPHTVLGKCWDSSDGTPADGSVVTVYIEGREYDTLTDVVGPTGNSGNLNGWSVNLGNLLTYWLAEEVLIIRVDNGMGYTDETSVIITYAGSDEAPSMQLKEGNEEIPEFSLIMVPFMLSLMFYGMSRRRLGL